MRVFKFSTGLQNGKISPVTLLKNDSITRSPGNFKSSQKNRGNICGGVNFQYSYRWAIGQLELLKSSTTKRFS